MKKRKNILSMLLCTAMVLSAVAVAPAQKVQAAGIENPIPAYKSKDVFATETVKVSGLTVKDTSGNSVTKSVQFTVYNSTKQEVQETVTSSNGVLPDLDLVKTHNYIFFVDDTEYMLRNKYVWVQNDGKLLDIKSANEAPYNYSEVTGFTLEAKATPSEEKATYGRRANFSFNVYLGTGPAPNCQFKFISEYETVEATTTDPGGRLVNVSLLEDVDYMVTVVSDTKTVEAFPITIKDKSEYQRSDQTPLGRYTYDHSDCKLVESITLIDKQDAHNNDTVLTSESGNTTVTGFNFKDMLLREQEVNMDIQELDGKNYDVIDIKAINPHRYEVAKLSAGEYTITEKLSGTKQAANVYYIDKDNNLQEVDFQQVGDKVIFTMNTLSLYPVVIEYGNEDIASGNKLLNVKVVDADNNPLQGVQLCLKPTGTSAANNINFVTTTDANGKAAYQCSNNETTGSAYELCVAEGGSYTCSSPKSVIFGAGSDNKTYISTVDSTTYTGSEITLTVTTAGGEDPGPVEDNRTLRVKVVDEDGNPVQGVNLELRLDGFTGYGCLAFTSATDASGMASYVCGTQSMDEMPGDYYELHPTENSGYTCDEPITVILGEDADGTFVEYVGEDEEEYTGEVLTLVVSAS